MGTTVPVAKKLERRAQAIWIPSATARPFPLNQCARIASCTVTMLPAPTLLTNPTGEDMSGTG